MDLNDKLDKIERGAKNSFVIYDSPKETNFLSGLIVNENKESGYSLGTFGSELCHELETCDEFFFSVAFITSDGIEDIANALSIVKQRGIKGRILTTDYETFTDPDALNNIQFNYHENIELKMFRCGNNDGFHPKAYIFRHDGFYRIYTGSSNLTRRALEVNKEWNTKVVCSKESNYLKAVLSEFDREWNDSRSIPWEDCLDYIETYRYKQKLMKQFEELNSNNAFQINTMQIEFLRKLDESIKANKKRFLLISATGSGKTYAAALGAKKIHAKRVLFVMNRQKVLQDSLQTFRKVMPEKNENEFALFVGGKSFNTDASFIFSTPEMIVSMIENKRIDKGYFDFVILDEVHHLGMAAKTDILDETLKIVCNRYKVILDYFTPSLGTLGMTATPIRMDGFDILNEFDNNVACQFTLSDSLNANLVCPFFYFGIDDEFLMDDSSTFFKRISKGKGHDENEYRLALEEICSSEHVEKILMQSLSHIYSGKRLKSLIFVPTIDIGKLLASRINEVFQSIKTQVQPQLFLGKAEFTEENYHSLEKQIERFETDEQKEDSISYLITVNKLAEGVDIPSINQVIFLRPTVSPIVFSQQLGRGLRLGKGYLVVLDFIGNNDRMNYLLPMSLLGVKSGDKLLPASAVRNGRMTLPGGSVVTLTPKAQKSILKSIDEANFFAPNIYRNAYYQAKSLLGRMPSMLELEEFGNIDAGNIVFTSLKNYYLLVHRYDSSLSYDLPENLINKLSYLQWKIGFGKRIQEPLLLLRLIQDETNGFSNFVNEAKDKYNLELKDAQIHFIYRVLSLNFEKDKIIVSHNSDCVFLSEENGSLSLDSSFKKELEDYPTFKQFVIYLLEYAVNNYSNRFMKRYSFVAGNGKSITVPFVLYEKYSYQDYYTLTENKQNKNPQFVGGYDTAMGEEIIPIFVNYNKNQSDRFNYKDYFVDASHFIWYTKERTRLDSPFIDRVRKYKSHNLKFLLFIRKEKKKTTEFFFLGSIKPTGVFSQEKKKGKDNAETDVVRIEMTLDVEVKDSLYQNLTYQDGLDD